MSNKFKQLAAEKRANQPRAAIPQVDPASAKPREPVERPDQTLPAAVPQEQPTKPAEPAPQERPIYLTPVDTSEAPANRGFHMYPSRHQQVTRDIAYIEGRKPWEIIEDALEEYVVKHYGKVHQRKAR
jgi:hypothetical protein